MKDSKSLEAFHPALRDWFSDTFREPTEIQTASWPLIRQGGNLLITAPTGSGKTLTAFFASIDRMVTGEQPVGMTNVLYVSPLKALNNDIERNLAQPLNALRQRFELLDQPFPNIRLAVRSGDTSQSDRQRMLRLRPEIVITTPESLALLLSTERGRQMLSTVNTVVLDEIHAIVESRRGAHLMVSLERLVEVAGEVQRIALSATVNPLGEVAKYVGGYDLSDRNRPVEIVTTNMKSHIDLRVRFPPSVRELVEAGDSTWPALISEFQSHLIANRSTLIFSASRRQSERITHLINEESDSILAYAHHGSLSREIRSEVESRLKSGDLKAIVATSSLELGIDVGELDEVVLVQSPNSVASAMQRIGRAGHRVGETSRATFYPMFARDFLDAAVIAHAVQNADIEPVKILKEPLDLLAQTVVSMITSEDWQVDRVFQVITRASVFHGLSRRVFDLVIEMLTGKYERSRIRDLRPRLALDEETGELTIRKGAALALYSSGGTIPDRGYFKLKHADSRALIGELDEEFVWETQVGKQFVFGSQQWMVTDITHNDVLVRAASAKDSIPPFYRSDFINRSFYFSQQIGRFLEFAEQAISGGNEHLLTAELLNRGFEEEAADELCRYLTEQRSVTGCDLPHTKHLVVERVRTAPGGYATQGSSDQLILHTSWGGEVNRPIALSLAAVWESTFSTVPDIYVDNQMIAIQLKQDVSPDEVLEMLSPDELVPKIRNSLEKSGFFGARFRECAGRALLLSKSRFDRRMPLWLTRMQAKDLMSAVMGYSDFPILLETWRSCLQDDFNLDATRKVLDELSMGAIRVSQCVTDSPSPFASTLSHDQLKRYVYADDSPEGGGQISSLSDELIAHALRDAALRPPLSMVAIIEVERKLQRQVEGYVPITPIELEEWVKDRVWIPVEEWFYDVEPIDNVEMVKLGDQAWYVHKTNVRLSESDLHTAVGNAVQFYGPRTRAGWFRTLPIDTDALTAILDDLISSGALVDDVVIDGQEEIAICDARNLSTILRFQRHINRPTIETRSNRELPSFIAAWNRFGRSASDSSILDVLERMQGFCAPIKLWLHDFWLSRIGSADLAQIAEVCMRYGVNWRGERKERISFGVESEFLEASETNQEIESVRQSFKDPAGSYSYDQLQANSPLRSDQFDRCFWEAVWNGVITSDSLMTVAQAHEQNYVHNAKKLQSTGRLRFRRSLAERDGGDRSRGLWRQLKSQSGLSGGDEDGGELEELEERKDRVRALLARYGTLCREICNREGGVFRWSELFKALRMMELSGELTSGLFFSELSGPQFLDPRAMQVLLDKKESPSFWINSYDPASPCGLGLNWDDLPSRGVPAMLGFVRGELLAVSRSYGKNLTILTGPEDARLDDLCQSLHLALTQRKRLAIETINEEPALRSEYLKVLSRYMDVRRTAREIYVDSVIRV